MLRGSRASATGAVYYDAATQRTRDCIARIRSTQRAQRLNNVGSQRNRANPRTSRHGSYAYLGNGSCRRYIGSRLCTQPGNHRHRCNTESKHHLPGVYQEFGRDNQDMSQPEPWLRGVDPEMDPVIGHLLRGSQHLREDMEQAIGTLTVTELWTPVAGLTCAAFHAKHLAGSTLRLCTYMAGEQLTAEQIAAIAGESQGSETASELLEIVSRALNHYDTSIRALHPSGFGGIREIGRKRLQTTTISLAIHIVEHGMRHVGLAIAAAKAARA